MTEIQYRHGDVLVRKVDRLPKGLSPVARDRGRVVLAYGEVTGHAHAFSAPNVVMFRDTGSGTGGKTFLSISGGPAALQHEEHATIDVPAGNYEVIGQVNYAPGAIPVRVAD